MMEGKQIGILVVDKDDYLLRTGQGKCLFPTVIGPETSNSAVETNLKTVYGISTEVVKEVCLYRCNLPCGLELECSVVSARLTQKRPSHLDAKWAWLNLDDIERELDAHSLPCMLMHVILARESDSGTNQETITCNESTFRTGMASMCNSFSDVQQLILHSASFDKKKLEFLFQYFTCLCWPNEAMNCTVFAHFCKSLKSKGQEFDPKRLFSAFDVECEGCLSFQSWVTGFALLQPAHDVKYNIGKYRALLIFAYFSTEKPTDTVPTLQMDDIRNMDAHTNTRKRLEMKWNVDKNFELTEAVFLSQVGNLTLRGTSELLRLEQATFPALYSLFPPKIAEQVCVSKGTASDCKGPSEAPSAPDVSRQHSVASTSMDCPMPSICHLNMQPSRLITENRCSNESDKSAHNLLKALHFFSRAYECEGAGVKPAMRWGSVPTKGLAACMLAVCDTLLKRNAQTCARINQPAYIIGCLDGDFEGLLELERNFWPLGFKFYPSAVVFVGGYAGRVGFGFEILAYLFAHKVLSPNGLHMLQSSTELVAPQHMRSFEKECLDQFGAFVGQQVYSKVCHVLSRMPQAAIIGHKVFCSHSGVVHPKRLKEANKTDDFVKLLSSSTAADLMHNAPAKNGQMEINFDGGGFAESKGANGGRSFSKIAVANFLHRFSFSYIITSDKMGSKGIKKMDGCALFMLNSACLEKDYCTVTVAEINSKMHLRILSLNCKRNIKLEVEYASDKK